jgi:predicted  nucleic acid-binding Zn-ribbon protein
MAAPRRTAGEDLTMTMTTRNPMFACLECGKKYRTVEAARKAMDRGCGKCGGSDIDLDSPVTLPAVRECDRTRFGDPCRPCDEPEPGEPGARRGRLLEDPEFAESERLRAAHERFATVLVERLRS